MRPSLHPALPQTPGVERGADPGPSRPSLPPPRRAGVPASSGPKLDNWRQRSVLETEKSPRGRSAGAWPPRPPRRRSRPSPAARARGAPRVGPRPPPVPGGASLPLVPARRGVCGRPGGGGSRRRRPRRRLPPPAPGGGRPGRGRGVCTDPPFVSGAFSGRPGAQGPGAAPAPGIASLPRRSRLTCPAGRGGGEAGPRGAGTQRVLSGTGPHRHRPRAARPAESSSSAGRGRPLCRTPVCAQRLLCAAPLTHAEPAAGPRPPTSTYRKRTPS